MSLVVYECDTCKRTIERVQNTKGLDFVGRCVITLGCQGILRFQELKKSLSNPSYPSPKTGVTDWTQTPLLYDFIQETPSRTWTVPHRLNANPAVQTYTYDEAQEIVAIDPIAVEYIDENTVRVFFENEVAGVAQCLVRTSAATKPLKSTTVQQETRRLSVSRRINLALLPLPGNTVRFGFQQSNTSSLTFFDLTLEQGGSNTGGWNVDVGSKVLINNKRYDLYFVDVGSLINQLPVGSFGYVGLPNEHAVTSSAANIIPFEDSQMYLLLTNFPYTQNDINTKQYGVGSQLTEANIALSLIVADGELSIFENRLKNTFPYIRIVK